MDKKQLLARFFESLQGVEEFVDHESLAQQLATFARYSDLISESPASTAVPVFSLYQTE